MQYGGGDADRCEEKSVWCPHQLFHSKKKSTLSSKVPDGSRNTLIDLKPIAASPLE